MEIKKSAKASLENKKGEFTLLGLVVALGFLYIAFEWTSHDVTKFTDNSVAEVFETEVDVDVTVQQETPPPPPPEPVQQAAPVIAPTINLKENDVQVNDVELATTEDDGSAVVDAPVQQQEEDVEEEEIFLVVQKKASFPGGPQKMMQWLSSNIKYPNQCQESGIQGRVIVQFTVNKDGSIKDVEVLKGVHSLLDEEAKRVVSKMPAWIPAEQQGNVVRSKFQLPVVFRLND